MSNNDLEEIVAKYQDNKNTNTINNNNNENRGITTNINYRNFLKDIKDFKFNMEDQYVNINLKYKNNLFLNFGTQSKYEIFFIFLF